MERARRRFSELLSAGLAGAPSVGVEDLTVAEGLPGRVYRPADPAGATVVFLHGGGWTVGSVADYDGSSPAQPFCCTPTGRADHAPLTGRRARPTVRCARGTGPGRR